MYNEVHHQYPCILHKAEAKYLSLRLNIFPTKRKTNKKVLREDTIEEEEIEKNESIGHIPGGPH
jgi:hypothetical protein